MIEDLIKRRGVPALANGCFFTPSGLRTDPAAVGHAARLKPGRLDERRLTTGEQLHVCAKASAEPQRRLPTFDYLQSFKSTTIPAQIFVEIRGDLI
jgi:hypothetical protein